MATLTSACVPRARLTYLGMSAVVRRHLSSSYRSSESGSYIRSDFTNQPFTGTYEPGGPTEGPLRDASNIGAPRITPTILKEHLDQFVVGQHRAKKTLATAVYHHYQRIQELQRRDEAEQEELAAEERRRMAQNPRHAGEGREGELKAGIAVPSLTKDWQTGDELVGQQQTTIHVCSPNTDHPRRRPQQNGPGPPPPLHDGTPLNVEKSNVLLLGPSGVGKTLMAKTLARVLEVPFSMSDCTPFTQAGYIGEDAEVCVQRLLAASNYDVTRAERGIICLDEIDKVATAKVSQGKDVSGEGVQQALLKIIEGTTLQIQARQERSSASGRKGQGSGYPTNSPLSGGNMREQSAGGKGEVYNVRTDNILFICAGAFNGLHKMILDRICKGSIGFGATVRAAPGASESDAHETMMQGEDELFEKHLPYYQPPSPGECSKHQRAYNTLDLVQPQDLQKYGLIPELVGRIPVACALSSLSVPALVQVLTEPRNSLLQQYQHLFALSSVELRFTTPALHAVAAAASRTGTGARGLRTVMERLLADAMFETPGSGVRHVLVNEAVAHRQCAAVYFSRGHAAQFRARIAEEEDAWEERQGRQDEEAGQAREDECAARARNNSAGGAARTFEEYREKANAAGFV